jgi:murein DD-endopeptidase MepM/ murein hydrolase activator NlpD
MREEPKSSRRFSIYHGIVFVLFVLSCVFYLAHRDLASKLTLNTHATLMSVTPVVPKFDFKPPAKPEPKIQEVVIGKNQTFSEVMESQGFDSETILQVYDGAKDVYNLARIGAGKTLVITSTPDSQFSKLEYTIDPFQKLVVNLVDNTIRAEMERFTAEVEVHELGGEIRGSLYSTIDKLGEEDELVIRFAEIFEWDVDFFKDLQAGDTFRIVYEKQFVRGQPYGYGKILAAELVNKEKTYQAVGYQHKNTWEFFSPDGKAMKKAFLASPLKFSRVSSGFTARRYHPVLKRYRPHYGIDYAAPAGTPVRAIGKGKVVLAGWAGGAGKTVKIQHDRDITTAYCHLSRYASGIRSGASVSQGQVIGYVGSTGLATGPHLDFRFMKKGKYINFLSIKSPQAEPLSSSEIAEFKAASAPIYAQLQNVKIQSTESPDIASNASDSSRFTEQTN